MNLGRKLFLKNSSSNMILDNLNFIEKHFLNKNFTSVKNLGII